MASRLSASDPHSTGPMPASREGPITTAPAPSAKINAVARSLGSVKSEIFSAPITSTCFEVPDLMKSCAIATPYEKPAQAALTSKAAALGWPNRCRIAVAAEGA